ncbi:hypothetical protein ACQ4PT_024888 [Festuca glaucescens]
MDLGSHVDPSLMRFRPPGGAWLAFEKQGHHRFIQVQPSSIRTRRTDPRPPAASCPALPRAAAAAVAVSAASHSSCPAPPPLRSDSSSSQQQHRVELLEMAGGFSALGPKTKNLVVAGGLTGFVLGVYYYTMHAVGGTDELQVAIDKFEDLKKKDAAESAAAATKPSAPGSS